MDHQYKILFVDDEIWIREKLKTIIDWKAHSFFLAEPAADGEEALNRIESESPDILITDINMPFISGAELIKRAKEIKPDIVCIALSGYSDFKYVRSALLAGAIDYLLKPISASDLLLILSKAVDEANKKQAEKRQKNLLQEEISRVSSAALDREFSNLIFANADKSETEYALLDDFELRFPGFSLVLFHTANLGKKAREIFSVRTDELVFKIKDKISRHFPENKHIVFNYIYRNNFFFMITAESESSLRPELHFLLDQLSHDLKSPVRAIISSYYYSFKKLNEAYDEVLMTLYCQPYAINNEVIYAGEFECKKAEMKISPEQEKQLSLALSSKNQQRFEEVLFEEIALVKSAEQLWNFIELRQVCDAVSWIIRTGGLKSDNLNRLNLDALNEALITAVSDYDLKEVISIIRQMMDEVFSQDTSNQGDTVRSTVHKVKEYIDKHYAEDLSLNFLADEFHIDSAYLSRIFKEEFDLNLILYLSHQRIEHAIEYMKNTDLNLTEIAALVGYGDYGYFNRVFKKIKGISPREYRERAEEKDGED